MWAPPQETCTPSAQDAGRRASPPRARRGLALPACVRGAAPRFLLLRRGSQPAAPSRRQLTPRDLRAPSPSPRGPRRPPPPPRLPAVGVPAPWPREEGGGAGDEGEAAGWQSLLGLSRTLPAPQRS